MPEIDINPIMREYVGSEVSSLIPDPRICVWSDGPGSFCSTHHRWKCEGPLPTTPPSPQEAFFYQAPALLARLSELAHNANSFHQIELPLVQLRHAIEHLNRRFTSCLNQQRNPQQENNATDSSPVDDTRGQ